MSLIKCDILNNLQFSIKFQDEDECDNDDDETIGDSLTSREYHQILVL